MMHIIISFAAFIGTVVAVNGATLFAPPNHAETLETVKVYSSLDEEVSKPLIAAFQKKYPNTAVSYEDLQSLEIYDRVIRETDGGSNTADLVISSAMDLQVKLVNDGYAQTVNSRESANWPDWAQWRNVAFGLTFEPSVVVYHKPSFVDIAPPENRSDLINLLKENEEQFYGKIATYDIERSGLGFLFLARDQEHNRNIWALVKAFGAAGVKLYSNSSAILERVANGRFLIGYNILGSYAESWMRKTPDLGLVMLKDYTVVMSRIALVPLAADNAALGKKLLSFLMSTHGQTIMAREVRLPALNPQVGGKNTATSMRKRLGSQLRPISIGPGLIVYLDQVKRSEFIARWNDALRGK
jgi:iron(III) transport system substrate-binding protein